MPGKWCPLLRHVRGVLLQAQGKTGDIATSRWWCMWTRVSPQHGFQRSHLGNHWQAVLHKWGTHLPKSSRWSPWLTWMTWPLPLSQWRTPTSCWPESKSSPAGPNSSSMWQLEAHTLLLIRLASEWSSTRSMGGWLPLWGGEMLGVLLPDACVDELATKIYAWIRSSRSGDVTLAALTGP